VLQVNLDAETDSSLPVRSLHEGAWRRSSYCANGTCVEIAIATSGVGVRDGKSPHDGQLSLSSAEWRAFLGALRAREFGGV
jgi:hypothetical protein